MFFELKQFWSSWYILDLFCSYDLFVYCADQPFEILQSLKEGNRLVYSFNVDKRFDFNGNSKIYDVDREQQSLVNGGLQDLEYQQGCDDHLFANQPWFLFYPMLWVSGTSISAHFVTRNAVEWIKTVRMCKAVGGGGDRCTCLPT